MSKYRDDPELREVLLERTRRWRKNNKEKTFGYMLKYTYGLSLEEYKQMVLNQHGECAVCEDQCDLLVDHCHITGTVRGLLCLNCNTLLGRLEARPGIEKKLLEYLN